MQRGVYYSESAGNVGALKQVPSKMFLKNKNTRPGAYLNNAPQIQRQANFLPQYMNEQQIQFQQNSQQYNKSRNNELVQQKNQNMQYVYMNSNNSNNMNQGMRLIPRQDSLPVQYRAHPDANLNYIGIPKGKPFQDSNPYPIQNQQMMYRNDLMHSGGPNDFQLNTLKNQFVPKNSYGNIVKDSGITNWQTAPPLNIKTPFMTNPMTTNQITNPTLKGIYQNSNVVEVIDDDDNGDEDEDNDDEKDIIDESEKEQMDDELLDDVEEQELQREDGNLQEYEGSEGKQIERADQNEYAGEQERINQSNKAIQGQSQFTGENFDMEEEKTIDEYYNQLEELSQLKITKQQILDIFNFYFEDKVEFESQISAQIRSYDNEVGNQLLDLIRDINQELYIRILDQIRVQDGNTNLLSSSNNYEDSNPSRQQIDIKKNQQDQVRIKETKRKQHKNLEKQQENISRQNQADDEREFQKDFNDQCEKNDQSEVEVKNFVRMGLEGNVPQYNKELKNSINKVLKLPLIKEKSAILLNRK